MKTLYISGAISAPTRSAERKNIRRFASVEKELTAKGYDVFNPARVTIPNATWEHYLARDLKWIYENRPTIYLLRGWQDSRGARLEVAFAHLLGLVIMLEETA